jgi:hypothetical protein
LLGHAFFNKKKKIFIKKRNNFIKKKNFIKKINFFFFFISDFKNNIKNILKKIIFRF